MVARIEVHRWRKVAAVRSVPLDSPRWGTLRRSFSTAAARYCDILVIRQKLGEMRALPSIRSICIIEKSHDLSGF